MEQNELEKLNFVHWNFINVTLVTYIFTVQISANESTKVCGFPGRFVLARL